MISSLIGAISLFSHFHLPEGPHQCRVLSQLCTSSALVTPLLAGSAARHVS